MNVIATPAMTRGPAQEIAARFDLCNLPPEFYANPYPVYQVLRETHPVRRMPDGSFFLTTYRLSTSPTRGGRARFRGFLQAPFSLA